VPDYTLPAFEKAADLQRKGEIDKARSAWVEFIANYPDSPKIGEAKRALGSINTGQVLSPVPSPEKTSYAVSKGDSLVKIASKFKSNPELIFRVNNLQTINLKIGQQLVIPQLDMSIVVDRKARAVTLFNRGQFFKEYQAVALKTPGVSTSVRTKVADKIALQGSNRVAFGDKNYSGSERWIMLSATGLAIRGLPEGAGAAPPSGIIVAQPDIEEIFLLVSRGTPVTIQ
jgi:LysM repeat protein